MSIQAASRCLAQTTMARNVVMAITPKRTANATSSRLTFHPSCRQYHSGFSYVCSRTHREGAGNPKNRGSDTTATGHIVSGSHWRVPLACHQADNRPFRHPVGAGPVQSDRSRSRSSSPAAQGIVMPQFSSTAGCTSPNRPTSIPLTMTLACLPGRKRGSSQSSTVYSAPR